MTWKSYAAASGATVLAGWLASTPPINVADQRPAAPARAPRGVVSKPASVDIEEQASRLQSRLRRETAYARPQRNPFRFEAAAPAVSAAPTPREPDVLVPPAPFVAPPPTVTLVGMAEDRSQQGPDRTAVLSVPDGILLVRVGDDVLGRYRVAAVHEDAIELTSLSDGSSLRLSLAR